MTKGNNPRGRERKVAAHQASRATPTYGEPRRSRRPKAPTQAASQSLPIADKERGGPRPWDACGLPAGGGSKGAIARSEFDDPARSRVIDEILRKHPFRTAQETAAHVENDPQLQRPAAD